MYNPQLAIVMPKYGGEIPLHTLVSIGQYCPESELITWQRGSELNYYEGLNRSVEEATAKNIPYVLVSHPDIIFTPSMKKIHELFPYLTRYNYLGLGVENSPDFMEPLLNGNSINTENCTKCRKKIIIWKCDDINHFFLAKSNDLINNPWDVNASIQHWSKILKRGMKMGYTKYCRGKYVE